MHNIFNENKKKLCVRKLSTEHIIKNPQIKEEKIEEKIEKSRIKKNLSTITFTALY